MHAVSGRITLRSAMPDLDAWVAAINGTPAWQCLTRKLIRQSFVFQPFLSRQTHSPAVRGESGRRVPRAARMIFVRIEVGQLKELLAGFHQGAGDPVGARGR